MLLEIHLLPRQTEFDVAIVVDILRMTTTSSVLLEQGLAELYVVADEVEARQVSKEKKALLLGERGGLPLPGFDGGNSPMEYLGKKFSGQSAVVCTSNGSKAVEVAQQAKHILLGSIVNARAVAKEALTRALTKITIICAGTDGQISFDDAIGAGIIATEIRALRDVKVVGDEMPLVTRAMQGIKDNEIAKQLKDSRHGQLVIDLGFEEDLNFAAKRNVIDIVAVKQGACFVGVRR